MTDHVSQSAQEAFWAEVARAYPEITTGDLDPMASAEFANACETVVRRWLMSNQRFATAYEHDAYALGVETAKDAASWVIDGNTKQEFIPAVLKMMDDGDPAVHDYLPREPNLSGEFADDLTPALLAEMILPDYAIAEDDLIDAVDACAAAFEEGVSDTFQSECERQLREAIS